MPQVTDGGSIQQPIVAWTAVSGTPIPGGSAAVNVVKSGTVEQAVEEASKAIKSIPGPADPGNLPANAIPNQLYTFKSQPGSVYFQGEDNIWYGLVAMRV